MAAARVRIMGIDPGSRYLGFGLVDAVGPALQHVAHGVVRTNGALPLQERLADIFAELEDVVARFRPEVVAVEGVFHHKNARSALVLGHARGVALLVAARAGLAVHEYAPARIKKSVGAGGNDGKGAVARMVATLLPLPEEAVKVRSDAYDALAVALCHAHQCRGALIVGPRRAAAGGSFRDRLKPAFVPGAAR